MTAFYLTGKKNAIKFDFRIYDFPFSFPLLFSSWAKKI